MGPLNATRPKVATLRGITRATVMATIRGVGSASAGAARRAKSLGRVQGMDDGRSTKRADDTGLATCEPSGQRPEHASAGEPIRPRTRSRRSPWMRQDNSALRYPRYLRPRGALYIMSPYIMSLAGRLFDSHWFGSALQSQVAVGSLALRSDPRPDRQLCLFVPAADVGKLLPQS